MKRNKRLIGLLVAVMMLALCLPAHMAAADSSILVYGGGGGGGGGNYNTSGGASAGGAGGDGGVNSSHNGGGGGGGGGAGGPNGTAGYDGEPGHPDYSFGGAGGDGGAGGATTDDGAANGSPGGAGASFLEGGAAALACTGTLSTPSLTVVNGGASVDVGIGTLSVPTGTVITLTGTKDGEVRIGTVTVADGAMLTIDGNGSITITNLVVVGSGAVDCGEQVDLVVTNKIAEKTPTASIDYENEELTGLIDEADYLIDDEPETMDETTFPIDEEWMTGDPLSIVKVGDGVITQDSDAQQLTIPERPGAPEGVSAIDESRPDRNDGKITGVTTDMEWSGDDGATWTGCTGVEVTGLAPGDYLVRLSASNDAARFYGEAIELTIADGVAPIPIPMAQPTLAGDNAIGGVHERFAARRATVTLSNAHFGGAARDPDAERGGIRGRSDGERRAGLRSARIRLKRAGRRHISTDRLGPRERAQLRRGGHRGRLGDGRRGHQAAQVLPRDQGLWLPAVPRDTRADDKAQQQARVDRRGRLHHRQEDRQVHPDRHDRRHKANMQNHGGRQQICPQKAAHEEGRGGAVLLDQAPVLQGRQAVCRGVRAQPDGAGGAIAGGADV